MSCGDSRMQCERHGLPGHVHVRRGLRDRRAAVLRGRRLCRRAIERCRLPVDARVRERPVRRRRLLQRRAAARRARPATSADTSERAGPSPAARRAAGVRAAAGRACAPATATGWRPVNASSPAPRPPAPAVFSAARATRRARARRWPGLPLAARRRREICVNGALWGSARRNCAVVSLEAAELGWNGRCTSSRHDARQRRDVLGSQGPSGKPPHDGPDGRRRRGGGRVRGPEHRQHRRLPGRAAVAVPRRRLRRRPRARRARRGDQGCRRDGHATRLGSRA